MKNRIFLIVVCIFLITSLLYGCSKHVDVVAKDDDNNTQISSGNNAEVGTYKIGLSAPITGKWEKRGKGFEVAANLAIEQINKNGGVRGKKLELLVGDSMGDVKQAGAVADKFVDNEEILAVVGDYSSACSMATAPIYKHRGEGLLQLSPSAGSRDFASVNEYMFSLSGDKDDEARFLVNNLIRKYIGAKKLSIIYVDNNWGKNTTQIIKDIWEDAELEIVSCRGYEDGVQDFTELIKEARDAESDALCIVMYYNDIINIFKQIQDIKWEIPVCNIGSGMSQKTIDLGGKSVEGLMCVTPFIVSDKDKELINIADEFKESAAFDIDIKSASAYDAVFLIANAIEGCEQVTRKSIAEELLKIKAYKGITGEITFNPDGDINRQYRIAKIVAGKWVPVSEYE